MLFRSVATTLARGEATVIVRTPQTAELVRLLVHHVIDAHITDGLLSVRGTTTAAVSNIAFDNRIQVVEITETRRSLEEILLDMTGASAEFAAA